MNLVKKVFLFIFIIALSFNATFAANKNAAKTAADLGWIESQKPLNVCGGFYQEPLLDFTSKQLIAPNDTLITADDASVYIQGGRSTLRGNITVLQPNKKLTSNYVDFYREPKTGDITDINLRGNIHLREPGKLILGEKAYLDLTNKSGWLEDVTYRIALSDEQSKQYGITQLYGLNAWGEAKKITRHANGNYDLSKTHYSTCPPMIKGWRLQAQKIHINPTSGRGKARNVTLKIRDTPVFYAPYFDFPTDDRRQSGFLVPTYAYEQDSGLDISAPFYWNLAPNYDATLTPRVLTKRGVMLGGKLRYLTRHSQGEIAATYLPDDRAFRDFKRNQALLNPPGRPLTRLQNAGDDRHAIHFSNTTALNANWTSVLHYNEVSDDYYFQDFGGDLASITQNQLLQQADLIYSSTHWNFLGRAQHYQTLHPINQGHINDIYSRLPQLVLNASYPDQLFDSHVEFDSEYNHFYRPRDPDTNELFPTGHRLTVVPSVSVPFTSNAGFIITSAQLHSSYYDLQDQPAGLPNSFSRTLPIISVDSGLFFDKHFTHRKKSYLQTLEPRLFYLYAPFREQMAIPNFDSGYYLFSFDQLFRTNRFSSVDRIGDANQLSVALTTRLIDQATGEERIQASIGQIIYLRDRDVTLCNTPGCSDQRNLGFTSPTETFSPIAGQLSYHVNSQISLLGDIAWDPNNQTTNNGSLNFQYRPAENKVINLGYAYLINGDILDMDGKSNNLDQFNASYSWPLSLHWSTLGAFNYNIAHAHPQTYFFGVEYNSCCWALRFIGGRQFKSLNQNRDPEFSNVFYLQVLLKGLGTLGTSNPSQILKNHVPGYRNQFN